MIIFSKPTTKNTGALYEDMAARYLQAHDFRILDRNFRSRFGEIDIIALERSTIVFVEVKFRKNNRSGTPLEAVNYYKQQKITKTAMYYLHYAGIPLSVLCRFDVIGIDGSGCITHIRNAFSAFI